MTTKAPLKFLRIREFRGSSRDFSIEFDSKKPLTLIYGENGSGKTTICDAFDFIANGRVGSLVNRGLGQIHPYWPTLGKTGSNILVELTVDGKTWKAQAKGRELFLKAAFRYATENACEHLFIHADPARHDYLIRLLQDFGFEERGIYAGDLVLVKPHPKAAPSPDVLPPLDYTRRYFPHFRRDAVVQKFLIPIQPHFHDTLFPDYSPHQQRLFGSTGNVGNAIKLAYLCHAQTNAITAGDVVLFYRTDDEKAVTSVGVVDRFEVLDDAARIASLVSRRTVYSIEEIDEMAKRRTKVILFRLVEHFPHSVPYDRLLREHVVSGPIQSIRKVPDDAFSRVLAAAGR